MLHQECIHILVLIELIQLMMVQLLIALDHLILTDIITEYRTIIDIYHENIIKNQIKTCLDQTRKSIVGFDLINKWKQFFIPHLN